MSAVLEAIRKRRSIRKFKPTPVEEKKLKTVLDAGRWAPSFSNLQPWRFIVVTDQALRNKLSEAASVSVLHGAVKEAPVTVVVCVDPEVDRDHFVEDGAIATQNMALAAYSLGLGSCWIGVYNMKAEGIVKEALNVPENLRVISLLPIGTPAETHEGVREKLESIVYRNKYGKK